MTYGDFKDLLRRTASQKVLCDKAINIAKTFLVVLLHVHSQRAKLCKINLQLKVKLCLTFYQKELQKTNQPEMWAERVIKRKGDKQDAKWKVYDNLFNSWIDKKAIVI